MKKGIIHALHKVEHKMEHQPNTIPPVHRAHEKDLSQSPSQKSFDATDIDE